MRLRIEPTPTPQEAEAIATAIEVLLARSGPTGKKLRFNDAALVRQSCVDIRRARVNLCDEAFPRDYTWCDMARIEALTPGV